MNPEHHRRAKSPRVPPAERKAFSALSLSILFAERRYLLFASSTLRALSLYCIARYSNTAAISARRASKADSLTDESACVIARIRSSELTGLVRYFWAPAYMAFRT